MRAYCPHCKTSRALPPSAKPGTTVYCQACKKPFVLSDLTVPGLKKRSLPFYNLISVIIIAALGYAVWYYYPKVIGKPKGVVVSHTMQRAFDKIFVEATVRNDGRPGIVRIAPVLILTGNRTKPYRGLGSQGVQLRRGQTTKVQFQWAMSPGEAKDVLDVEFRITGE